LLGGSVRIVCGSLQLADCIAMVSAIPESRVTEAAQAAVVNFDCGAAVCQDPQPVSVAFLRYDATLESIRTTPTWRVERKGSRLVASRERSVSFAFEVLLRMAMGPTFAQPSRLIPSPPIVCGRITAGFCGDAIAQALAAYPASSSAAGVAAEYTCPPGAWCPAITDYVVAFVEPGTSSVAPWPPTYRVQPAFPGTPARTTPWPAERALDDYITAVIREAGWVPADPPVPTASPAACGPSYVVIGPSTTFTPPPSNDWNLGPLLRTLKNDPRYGGIYIACGDTIVIGVTRNADEITTLISPNIPPGAKVEVHLVHFSWSDLSSVKEAVDASWQTLIDGGLGVNSNGVDPVSNRVVVGIKPYSAQVADSLATRFGPEIRVVEHDLDVYP